MQVPVYQREIQQAGLPDVKQTANVGADNFLGNTEQAFIKTSTNEAENANKAMEHLYAEQMHENRKIQFADYQTKQDRFDINQEFGYDGKPGWVDQKGDAVLNQQNNIPLPDNVMNDRNQFSSQLIESIPDEGAREMARQYAQQSANRVLGRVKSHEYQQIQEYKLKTLSAGIDSKVQSAAKNYTDPDGLKASIESIHDYAQQLGAISGNGSVWASQYASKYVSNALSNSIQSALMQNDHASAANILHDFSKHMDMNDMMMAYKGITEGNEYKQSLDIAQSVMSSAYPKMISLDGDRALNITFSSESGGKHFKPGTQEPIVSPKGAVGIAQVMPATAPEAAKLAGLEWNEERFRKDPEYNKALGAAYLNKQLDTFGGDFEKAWAAYNAGAGAVQKAIKESNGCHWLSALPEETQAYVNKNMQAFRSGAGQFQRPSLQDVHTQAMTQLGNNPSASLIKLTLAEVGRQYEEQSKAIQQREEEGVANAMRALQHNGGKMSALDANTRAAIPPKEFDNLISYAEKIAKGDAINTDWPLYYKLKTDPALLQNSNLMAYRNHLGDTEFKQLTEEQQNFKSGQGQTQARTAHDVLNGFMREAGIDPTPKDNDEEGAAMVGRIWSVFEQRLQEAEQDNGRELKSDEVQAIAAKMFTRVPIKWLLYGTNTKPAVLIDSLDRLVVPEGDRKQIIDVLRKGMPGEKITEDSIRYTYAKARGLL